MEKNCSVPLKTEWVHDQTNKEDRARLFVVELGNPSIEKTVMVAANEHARELITAEVALGFLKKACGATSVAAAEFLLEGGDAKRATTLQNVRYVILPVVNMAGRQLVEQGKKTCQRYTTDEEGSVDLNRNADVDWGKGEKQNWGTSAFSTYQARIMRDVAEKHKPIAYIDLHSGARSLMTSWGFQHVTDPDYPDQEKLLKVIQEGHCKDCRIGANSVTIGYDNPGEIIDHMYAKQGIKYSTLWELWMGGDGSEPCIGFFNPYDKHYEKQVDNWSEALFTFGGYVHTTVDSKERSNPGRQSSLMEGARVGGGSNAVNTRAALKDMNHLKT
jgi:hypothetical protein